MVVFFRLFFCVFSVLLLAKSVIAETKVLPTWEVGAAFAGQSLADYRGSNSYNTKLLVLPFFVYRGERLKIDKGGIRGELFSSPRWELNVSAEVALGGTRKDNELRVGMPQLNPTLELGPSVNYRVFGKSFSEGLLLRLPIRGVVAVSRSGADPVGYIFNPKLTYINPKFGGEHWRMSGSVGLNFATEAYHDYFYQVDPVFQNTERRSFDAKPGYSGSYFKGTISRRQNNWRYGLSLRYDNLRHTVFEKSPLVETTDYFSVSFVLARYLWSKD